MANNTLREEVWTIADAAIIFFAPSNELETIIFGLHLLLQESHSKNCFF